MAKVGAPWDPASAMEQLLQQLNPQQRQAVQTTQGRLLILAGAGSGKTKVLMSRIAYLIGVEKVPAQEILGLTFTNRAAAEMRERLSHLIGDANAKSVTLSTFHSFCLHLLRQHACVLGFTRRFSLYHEHDVRRLVQQIVRDALEHDGQLPSLAATFARLDQARQLGVQPIELPEAEEPWHHRFCQQVYESLRQAFRAYDAIDFDGLLEYAVELLEKHPDIAQQLPYRYVMIDEYQDTNPIQDRLARAIASHGNLCVVGDDDQSIYGWRGGRVRNILEFPAQTLIKLEQNYRSTNTILKAANRVIALNQERYHKTLWSQKGEGSSIEIFYAPTQKQEAEAVVRRLVALKEREGLRWRDCAILYRSNSLARTFETVLLRHSWQDGQAGPWRQGIPYEVFGGDSFYDCREVRDLVAYLRLISNPHDLEALLRVINQPRRGIGEATLDLLTRQQRQLGGHLIDYLKQAARAVEVVPAAREGIGHFLELLAQARLRFASESLSSSLEWLIERVEYERAIQEEVKSEPMRQLKRQNLAQLVESAAEFETEASSSFGLDRVCEFAAIRQLDNSGVGQKVRQQDAVHLMTFHSAKGLEFPAVFLVGLEDHILPHERSIATTGLEEERRLFYVALTRAQKFLSLSMATLRDRHGKPQVSKPSRFLFDIPQPLLRITKWDDC